MAVQSFCSKATEHQYHKHWTPLILWCPWSFRDNFVRYTSPPDLQLEEMQVE